MHRERFHPESPATAGKLRRMPEMAQRKSSRRLQRFRWALLALLVVGSGGLLGWIALRSQRSGGGSDNSSPSQPLRPMTRALEALVTSEGFQFEHQRAGRVLFRLAGERFQLDREGWVSIEEVAVELAGGDQTYVVRSRTGRFRETDRTALLEGEVELSSSEGLRLRGSEARLLSGGDVVEMVGPVSIEGMGLRGGGGSASLQLDRRQLRIHQGLVLESLEESSFGFKRLQAQELTWFEPEAQIQLSGDVELDGDWGSSVCGQGLLFFDPSTRKLRNFLLQWEVRGKNRGFGRNAVPTAEASPSSFEWMAEEVRGNFSPDGSFPLQVTLEARIGERVRLLEHLQNGRVLEIAARFVVVDFQQGVPREAYAFQPVYLSEYLADNGSLARRGLASQALLEFGPTGKVQRISLLGGIELEQESSRLRAERVWLDVDTQDFEALGEPAHLVERRGELWAPKIQYQGKRGQTKAAGGVRAVLVPAAWERVLPSLNGSETIRIEGQEALMTELPRTAFFQGQVQAWQGSSVLFAEQLQLEPEAQRFSASGGVRTIWPAGPGSNQSPAPQPIQVSAGVLSYRPSERRLEYLGDVKAWQAGRSFQGQELIAVLNAERQPERWLGRGTVVLEEPERRLRIEAERVEYDSATRLSRFFGRPVRLVDPRGIVEGALLEYQLETGVSRWSGGEGE